MSISDWFRADSGYDYELARIVSGGDDLALLRFYHSRYPTNDEHLKALAATKRITSMGVQERDAGFMEAYLIMNNAFCALPDKVRYKDGYIQAVLAARGKRR